MQNGEIEIHFYLRGTNQINASCEVLCRSLVAQWLKLKEHESRLFSIREVK